jgi:hypothetical protein
MNIICNPWTARKAVDAYKAEADRLHEMNSKLEQLLREAQLRSKLAEAHIDGLNEKLKGAHFRNPETGRIGRKGEQF